MSKNTEFPNIAAFLKHLFQEYYDNEMILDYLTIIATKPEQKLPILCLAGNETPSGKSTFAELINMLFETSLILENDLHCDFNSHWIKSDVIVIDEGSRRNSYEKLKFLATATTVMCNERRKPCQLIDFKGKFIVLSNVEEEKNGTRVWTVQPKRVEVPNWELHGFLLQEAPAFLAFIASREIKHPQSDRLWFNPEDFVKADEDNSDGAEQIPPSVKSTSPDIDGTAFQIIAEVTGLVQVGNAWVDKGGERFVLTKYGFQYAVIETNKIHERQAFKNLRKKIDNLKTQKNNLERKLSEHDKTGIRIAYDAGLQDGYHNLGVSHFDDWYKEHFEEK